MPIENQTPQTNTLKTKHDKIDILDYSGWKLTQLSDLLQLLQLDVGHVKLFHLRARKGASGLVYERLKPASINKDSHQLLLTLKRLGLLPNERG